jgi:hypothetical protein
MIAKRLGAIALTVALILGAWLIRDRVIDDDGGVAGDDEPPRTEREIVCVSDLREACDALAGALDLDIRIEDAGATLDAFADQENDTDPPIWITMEPFAAMADMRVVIRGGPEEFGERIAVASSAIALVVPSDRVAVLAAACGEPLDWRCIGDAAGNPWEDIGGEPSWGTVRPGFTSVDRASGLLGVGAAVAGYFGDTTIVPDDPDFQRWARPLAEAVPASALTGRTAIVTIETRPSALDIAVGAAAELSDPGGTDLSLQYADPMIRADVVVAVPDGMTLPNGIVEELARLLVTEGRWDSPSAGADPLPTALELLAIRGAWKALS